MSLADTAPAIKKRELRSRSLQQVTQFLLFLISIDDRIHGLVKDLLALNYQYTIQRRYYTIIIAYRWIA